jgi:Putative MetA-pathway of phenol degradation
MRELVTDRPDKTESPYTVDAGHYQLEMDLVSYSDDKHNRLPNATEVESWTVPSINLKAGLLNNLDAQLILLPYNKVRVHERATGLVTRQHGFGDVTARLKYNLWGNDEGKTALGLLPFVKLPTSYDGLGNNSVEGGLIIPLALSLPGDFGLGAMTEVDAIRDSFGGGYHPEFINSITLGHDLFGNLGGYVEFFSLVSAESRSPWIGTFDVGLTYGIGKNIQLDCGVNIGLTRSADDVNPFLGISFRY